MCSAQLCGGGGNAAQFPMPGIRQLTGTGMPAASTTMSLPATPISVRACAGVTAKFAVVGWNARLPVKNGSSRASAWSRRPSAASA